MGIRAWWMRLSPSSRGTAASPRRTRTGSERAAGTAIEKLTGVASLELFAVPTAFFKLLYGLVILGCDRRLLTVEVISHPRAEWIAQQFTDVFPQVEAPSRKNSDEKK